MIFRQDIECSELVRGLGRECNENMISVLVHDFYKYICLARFRSPAPICERAVKVPESFHSTSDSIGMPCS